MKLRCDGCQREIEVPDTAPDGWSFDCPNWAGTPLRFRRNPPRLEAVPWASCPMTEERILLPDDLKAGTEARFACGHRHRATYEFGAWALEG